jgi:hypothetical protein
VNAKHPEGITNVETTTEHPGLETRLFVQGQNAALCERTLNGPEFFDDSHISVGNISHSDEEEDDA